MKSKNLEILARGGDFPSGQVQLYRLSREALQQWQAGCPPAPIGKMPVLQKFCDKMAS